MSALFRFETATVGLAAIENAKQVPRMMVVLSTSTLPMESYVKASNTVRKTEIVRHVRSSLASLAVAGGILALGASTTFAATFGALPSATSTNSPSEAICIGGGGAGQNFDVARVTVWPANDTTHMLWYEVDQTTFNAQHQFVREKKGNAQLVPFATTEAPAALVTFNNRFVMMHQGTDGNVYYDTAACPVNDTQTVSFLGNWQPIPGAVQPNGVRPNLTVRPGVGVSNNGQWLMVATSFTDNSIRYSLGFGTGAPTWNNFWSTAPGNGTTTSGIGVTSRMGSAADQTSFEVFHRGTNSELFYNSYNASTGAWGNNNTWIADGVPINMAAGPAVATLNSFASIGFPASGFIILTERSDHSIWGKAFGMDLKTFQQWKQITGPGVSLTNHAPSIAASTTGEYLGASYTAQSDQIFQLPLSTAISSLLQ